MLPTSDKIIYIIYRSLKFNGITFSEVLLKVVKLHQIVF